MLVSKFPRVKLCHRPTPLEEMPRFSKLLGGANLLVKRDDCTGLAGGGNKTRKLEFLMADAIKQGADTIITQGAVQSNHVRQTVAAASKLGLKSRAILERRVLNTEKSYEETGNVFLDYLLGVESMRYVPAGLDLNAEMEKDAEIVRKEGGKPYIIPGGGSNPIGALGYIDCAEELLIQAKETGLKIDWIIVASGSSGTHAGLAAGLTALDANHIKLQGISVRAAVAPQIEKIYNEAVKTLEYIGSAKKQSKDHILVNSDYVGEGYGLTTESMTEAVILGAQYEGLLLDPIYTGKACAGMIGLVRKGVIKKGENVVFMHTGGIQDIFAYENHFRKHLLNIQPEKKLAAS